MTSSQDYNSQSTSWIDKQGHEEGTDTNLNRCHLDAASAQLAFCHQSLLPPADKQSFTFNSQVVQCSVVSVVANTTIKSSTHHSSNQSGPTKSHSLFNQSTVHISNHTFVCSFLHLMMPSFLPLFPSISQSFAICSFLRSFISLFVWRRHLHLWHLPCQCTPFG